MDPRYCARIGCGDTVTTIMQVVPRSCQVVLGDPVEPMDHEGIPLCGRHAERVTLPQGWDLVDVRRPPPSTLPRKRRRRAATRKEAPSEPSGSQPSEPAEAPDGGAAPPAGPELAVAETAGPPPPAPPAEPPGPPEPAGEDQRPGDLEAGSSAEQEPSRPARKRRTRRERDDTAAGPSGDRAGGDTPRSAGKAAPGGQPSDPAAAPLLSDDTEGLDRGTDDEPTLWVELHPRMKELDTDESTPLINRAFRWAHSLE